jgi:hypothetical protein
MFLFGIIIIILVLIAYQDYQERAVSFWVFPLLAGLFITYHFMDISMPEYLFNTVINLSFCVIQYLVLTLYFSVRHKQVIHIADKFLGWGDIVMTLVLCLVFPPLVFFLFFFVSLLVATILGIYLHYHHKTIPLAGIQAIVLIIWIMMVRFIIGFSIYDDSWIIDFLI